jgi:nucleotide-binding universal stress UspA family protein
MARVSPMSSMTISGGTMVISRILVPTDFSTHADAALEYARELARVFDASLHLLHVVENPLVVGAWASDTHAAEITGLQATLVRDSAERLTRLSEDAADWMAVTTEVRTGAAADQILESAAERHIDLIVMGTHGRTGLAHLVMGSVAERVVRKAASPVLTLHLTTVDHATNSRQIA